MLYNKDCVITKALKEQEHAYPVWQHYPQCVITDIDDYIATIKVLCLNS